MWAVPSCNLFLPYKYFMLTIIYFMNKKVSHSLINIGTSKDRSIREFAKLILKILNVKLKKIR